MECARLALRVYGVVQGVGFRPWALRRACELRLGGWVSNTAAGAELELEGSRAALRNFVTELYTLPPPARVERVEEREVECLGERRFQVTDSQDSANVSAVNAYRPFPLGADLAVCHSCLTELLDPTNRRFHYPFIQCTSCGPRYSFTRRLPYDRATTTLSAFAPCATCEREYNTPNDRRFLAQGITCTDCGPRLQMYTTAPLSTATPLSDKAQVIVTPDNATAIYLTAQALRDGKIVAMLGLGGFQLLVDATNEAAVQRLRWRKQRPSKPFAVLFENATVLAQHCAASSVELDAVQSPQAPIVLLNAAPPGAGGRALAPSVAPNCQRIGALLPTTALHLLLAKQAARPLICTSGNRGGEPLCGSLERAQECLASIADLFLSHNRAVEHPIDDSVAQVVQAKVQLLRRARGYVPTAVGQLPLNSDVLALGGHLKSTFALARQGRVLLSPHLGDLGTVASQAHFEATVRSWLGLFAFRPQRLVCDLHPGYASTVFAQRLSHELQVPLLQVQHHHAHVAAVMAEHPGLGAADAVLGFAWDGAGLGSDGSLWGGETLLCERGGAKRVASLLPFGLPGGASAMREPRRAALGLLGAGGFEVPRDFTGGFTPPELRVLQHALSIEGRCPQTSSVGRLFDAVAALSGVRQVCDHEGQAASELMQLAEQASASTGRYPLPVDAEGNIDWRPLVAAVLEERTRQTPQVIARRFHEALVDVVVQIHQRFPGRPVALAGGCFQNRWLVRQIVERISRTDVSVYFPHRVPANDGGLSLGQAWLACFETPAVV